MMLYKLNGSMLVTVSDPYSDGMKDI